MLGLPGREDGYGFDHLTEQQSHQCLQDINDEAAAPGETSPFRLSQAFSISRWRSSRRHIPTNSLICIKLGRMPGITTFLEFETFELFQHIKRVFAEVRALQPQREAFERNAGRKEMSALESLTIGLHWTPR